MTLFLKDFVWFFDYFVWFLVSLVTAPRTWSGTAASPKLQLSVWCWRDPDAARHFSAALLSAVMCLRSPDLNPLFSTKYKRSSALGFLQAWAKHLMLAWSYTCFNCTPLQWPKHVKLCPYPVRKCWLQFPFFFLLFGCTSTPEYKSQVRIRNDF